MKTAHKALATLLLTLGLAAPAAACAKGGPHHGPGGPHGPNPARMVKMLERNADALGVDAATLDKIKATVAAGTADADALESDLRDAHQALRAAMESDTPDKAEVLRLVERAGAARTALDQHRTALLLDVRVLLTPAQRTAIKELRAQKRAERGERHGNWKKGKAGKAADPR